TSAARRARSSAAITALRRTPGRSFSASSRVSGKPRIAASARRPSTSNSLFASLIANLNHSRPEGGQNFLAEQIDRTPYLAERDVAADVGLDEKAAQTEGILELVEAPGDRARCAEGETAGKDFLVTCPQEALAAFRPLLRCRRAELF